MRTIVEVIKRLYQSGRLSKAELAQRVDKGTITEAEYQQIVGVA